MAVLMSVGDQEGRKAVDLLSLLKQGEGLNAKRECFGRLMIAHEGFQAKVPFGMSGDGLCQEIGLARPLNRPVR